MKSKARFSHELHLALVSPDATLEDAAASLNRSGLLVCCVVDAERRLLGILTDSDLRRALLSHTTLRTPVEAIFNAHPFTCADDVVESALVEIAKQTGKREIPLVDDDGCIQDIFILGFNDQRTHAPPIPVAHSSKAQPPLDADMFVLAGGLGTRLRPVVSDRPKPLAMVGERPIIEHLLLHAKSCGLQHFFISLNYRADMIEQHLCGDVFQDFDFTFVREPARLGTAGSLRLVRDRANRPLIVCNGDLLTNVPFRTVLEAHTVSGADITSVVRLHKLSVPYGVVDVEGDKIVGLREKPELSFVINAGIYILSQRILQLVNDDEVIDMPDLIKRAIGCGHVVRPFLMHEYWLDVGKPEDFQRANEDVQQVFRTDT